MMHRELTISTDVINEAQLVASRKASDGIGAVICFSGLVRSREGEGVIAGIDYEAFIQMAEHQFKLLFDQMEQRWPVESIRLVHRIGFVAVNEPSLWVEITTPHRAEAFAACQWLIDEMKRVVPIWKKAIQNPVAG